ncbi:MAG: hypothetical protein AAGH17_03045 [Pseudomonadota bacterium]
MSLHHVSTEAIPSPALHQVLETDLISDDHWDNIDNYADTMKRDGYVKFPNLLNDLAQVISQQDTAFRPNMRMKDFIMPEVNSQRTMKVLSGTELANASPIFFTLYFHHEVRDFLSKVVGSSVHSVQHRSEFMVSNMLSGQGHTHGWHLDDPQYAFVVFLDSPKSSFGGALEFVPNWRELCLEKGIDPNVDVEATMQELGDEITVFGDAHQKGDAYLLDAGSHLHRVAPLQQGGGDRWVVNMAFDSKKHIDFGETADVLYG